MNNDNDIDKIMKQVHKQLSDDYKVLNFGETFKFSCEACGSCCRNRKDILLTPFDVYRASKYLNINPNDFIKKYGDLYLGSQSYLPLMAMKFIEISYESVPYTVCPFNKKREGKGLCTIHSAKPFVCLCHPVGRITMNSTNNRIIYIVSNHHCGHNSEDAKEYILETWFEGFDLEKSELVGEEYNSIYSDIARIIDLEKLNKGGKVSKDIINMFYTELFHSIYFDIDLDKDILDVVKEKRVKTREKTIDFVHVLHKAGINVRAKGYKLDEDVLRKLSSM